jgi:hypothetical protein
MGGDSTAEADREHLRALCAVVAGDPRGLQAALHGPRADPAGFLRFAQRHRLLGYLHHALRRRGLAALLPAPLLDTTRHAYMRQLAANEQHAAELTHLLALLEREDMLMLVLKGLPVAERYYGDLGARSIADLDVMVRRETDVEQAEELLLANGYAATHRTSLKRRLRRAFSHHLVYKRGQVSVEVHWVLHRHPSVRIDADRLWRESAIMDFRGYPCLVPSTEYQLVLQIMSLLADLPSVPLVLKPFVDLHQMLAVDGEAIDWVAFFRRRREEGVARSCAYFLALMLELLDCHAEFPRLADYLRSAGPAPRALAEGRTAVLHGNPRDPRQKLAALRLYDTPLAAAACWWVLSLPYRVVVFRPRRAPATARLATPESRAR